VRFEVPVPAVHVSVPPRQTTTVVERDESKRITRTVSTDQLLPTGGAGKPKGKP
jgi:hypothetical protein